MGATVISAVLLAAVAAPPAEGTQAPDFNLRTPGGANVRLSALVEKGPVVVVVLRGWSGKQCPICRRQVSELIARRQDIARYAKHVVLVYPGPADGIERRAGEFLTGRQDLPEPLTLVLDPDYSMIRRYALRWNAPRETSFPTTMVIDSDGIVRWSKISRSHGGRASAKEILAALRAL